MRTHIARLAAAVAILAAPAVAHAQGVPAFRSSAIAAKVDFADTTTAARARTLLANAEKSWKTYDLARARRDYASAVELMRAHDVYAGPALVSLAHVTYATDSHTRAAKVLVEAAREAAKYGDLALQARSLFEASVLYGQSDDVGAATQLLAEVQKLMTSPYLPEDVKQEITRRIDAR